MYYALYDVYSSVDASDPQAAEIQEEVIEQLGAGLPFLPFLIGAPLLIPTLTISRAVGRLRTAVNDLRPRLLEPGAVGDMEAGRLQKNLQTIELVREVETHMQSLNRGRGLGFSLMGVQLNPRALGTVIMAAASVAVTFKRVLADQEAALA